jgi:hypothetical protein
MVRDARGETEPLAQERARGTYYSDVSVALLFSAFESAAAPAAPIRLFDRLQRGEEGQGCSWRDMAADTEKGGRHRAGRAQLTIASSASNCS